uniref:Endophilin-A2 n=1 Tax=Latimeria chalumnae TaxID=7897 RepID=H3A3L9_LATCH
FVCLFQKVDITSKAVAEVLTKTTEYLQPNPASRAKLTMLNTVSKFRGQVKNTFYPQSEGLLGECMIRYGKELGEESNFEGGALLDAGETMKRLAEVKDSLDIEVKQNFIDPLQSLCDKDLKEIQHHLKKLEGRRLDYDYKKKRQGKIPDEEIRQAMEKFDESKDVAENSMHNLLETDIEQVSQLSALVEAQLEFHKEAASIMEDLSEKLKARRVYALTSPSGLPVPRVIVSFFSSCGMKSLQSTKRHSPSSFQQRPARVKTRTPKGCSFAEAPSWSWLVGSKISMAAVSASSLDQPCCKALYDFDPENEGELGFKEGDIITLTNQIDENWYEGMLNSQSGFFPLNYVDVLVPLP